MAARPPVAAEPSSTLRAPVALRGPCAGKATLGRRDGVPVSRRSRASAPVSQQPRQAPLCAESTAPEAGARRLAATAREPWASTTATDSTRRDLRTPEQLNSRPAPSLRRSSSARRRSSFERPPVVCCLLPAACCLSPVACRPSPVALSRLSGARHPSYVRRPSSIRSMVAIVVVNSSHSGCCRQRPYSANHRSSS